MTATPGTTAPPATGQQNTLPASPLITGGRWFDADGRPYLLRMELPVSAGEMVAALYGEYSRLLPADLATDESVWASVAISVVHEGLHNIVRLADEIRKQERASELVTPEWLAFCRRRVAEVAGREWQAAKHRCPCGYATDDTDAFDEHLGATDGMEPEHFEAVDGWTLEQAWAGQASMTARAVTCPAPGH